MADQLAGSYTIGGFDLILSTPDARFGRATYVHSDVADASPVSSSRCSISRTESDKSRFDRSMVET